jgi:hypothetical protein
MTPEQLRFLRLHQSRLVERTQPIFRGAMVRATSDRGEHATVRIDELEGLIGAGLLAEGLGGSFLVTSEGRQV